MTTAARLGETAEERAEALAQEWSDLGFVHTRAMFGGRGIFVDETMFAMVERDGTLWMKGDPETREVFEEVGGERHHRMTYWSLPDEVVDDPEALHNWAHQSIAIARD